MADDDGVKVKSLLNDSAGGGFSKYRRLYYGDTSLLYVLKAEIITSIFGNMPGAAGLFLRSKLYPSLLAECGHKSIFGKNITFRHPGKIKLGSNVIIDDNCVIDAKGESNSGIILGDNVFIGRNSIVYCKGGDIHLKKGVSVSSNCTIFSSNSLTIGDGTVIGGYSYILSGGEYNYKDTDTRFIDQTGMETKGPLQIGENCWLGARVTVLDGANIGDCCVIGAAAVVNKPIESNTLAAGVPARKIKSIQERR